MGFCSNPSPTNPNTSESSEINPNEPLFASLIWINNHNRSQNGARRFQIERIKEIRVSSHTSTPVCVRALQRSVRFVFRLMFQWGFRWGERAGVSSWHGRDFLRRFSGQSTKEAPQNESNVTRTLIGEVFWPCSAWYLRFECEFSIICVSFLATNGIYALSVVRPTSTESHSKLWVRIGFGLDWSAESFALSMRRVTEY